MCSLARQGADVNAADDEGMTPVWVAALEGHTQTVLELLHRGADKAEARMCAKFGRREFRVYVNGELLWSRNYAIDETVRFDEDAAAKHTEFVALGWESPDAVPEA